MEKAIKDKFYWELNKFKTTLGGMHIKLFKYAKCNNCNRICKNKNKKTLLLRDTLFENNYLCLYWFIRNYQMRKKVKKSLKRMSDETIKEMINSTLFTLNYELIKRKWEDVKNSRLDEKNKI